MMDKKQAAAKNKPIHTIHCGEVTVCIFQRQSNAGFVYWDYLLTRTWHSAASRKESHGTTFFAKHEKDLIEAIQLASEWLRARSRETSTDEAPDDESRAVEQNDKAPTDDPLTGSRQSASQSRCTGPADRRRRLLEPDPTAPDEVRPPLRMDRE